MGIVIWPILMIAVFGCRYIIKWYEQDRSQLMKLLCIFGLAASGFILIYWGFTLGIILAGTIQIAINMARYAKDPVKLEAELGTEFRFEAKDIVELVLLMTIMAVICVIAFKSLRSYLRAVRPNAAGNFLNRRQMGNLRANKSQMGKFMVKSADEKKQQNISSVFCPKCGSRVVEGTAECPGCGRKRRK